MNLKPINEVPEIESLQEGDKILVNSNGTAKQIAARKVGGLPTGGEPHQQLVTDKDGNAKFEDRPFYAEPMQGEVLPETELMAGVDEGQFTLLTPPTTMPVDGVNHTVVYNGASYECVAIDYSADDGEGNIVPVGVFLGNTGLLYGEPDPTGPLFGLMIAYTPDQGLYGVGMALDGSESFTISININGEKVKKKLDPKFLHGNTIGTIYGVLTELEGGAENDYDLMAYADKAMTKPMTYAEGLAILEKGMRICCKFEGGTEWMYSFPTLASDAGDSISVLLTVYEGALQVTINFHDT